MDDEFNQWVWPRLTHPLVFFRKGNMAMSRLPIFGSGNLEGICHVIGDTSHGLTGSEIGYILQEIKVEDVSVGATKWIRIYNALVGAQNRHQVGNHVVMFLNRAMNPARYRDKVDQFNWLRGELSVALAFSGYAVNEKGQIVAAAVASTLDEAKMRAGRLRSELERRKVHTEVLNYCRAELVDENYFHAVFEATKGVAERIRKMSGLAGDGGELISKAFSIQEPILLINSLSNDSERSEHKGFANLLIGVFGAIRNPLAHAPKIIWGVSEIDALDMLTMLSLIHRKLDSASKADEPAP